MDEDEIVRTIHHWDEVKEVTYNERVIHVTRKYLFQILYPDGNIENIEYGESQTQFGDHSHNRDIHFRYESLKIANTLSRMQCIQKIINKLENSGYKVSSDQISLFMSNKISRLIMKKNM
jgi:hypothetical protein